MSYTTETNREVGIAYIPRTNVNLLHHNSHTAGHGNCLSVTVTITMVTNDTIYFFPDQGGKWPWCKPPKLPSGFFAKNHWPDFSLAFFPSHRVSDRKGPFKNIQLNFFMSLIQTMMPRKRKGPAQSCTAGHMRYRTDVDSDIDIKTK